MKPIKYNDKGPAVEDIQRRLRVLGYKIGSETNNSAFLDETLAAVHAFQQAHGIEPTGAVGPRTWSTLVDSTFELGDRMLYLRMPYFHGADVAALQHALNSLGFVTGGADGIFGASTEAAVTEFQQNYDINPDGLVGTDTLRALLDLNHIWGAKEGRAHSSVKGMLPQQYQALMDFYFDFQAVTGGDLDSAVQAALRRLVRYANNLEDAARADLPSGGIVTPAITVLIHVVASNFDTDNDKLTCLSYQNDFKSFAASLAGIAKELQKLKDSGGASPCVVGRIPSYELCVVMPLDLLEAGSESSLPLGLQLMASRLLDALCLAVIE